MLPVLVWLTAIVSVWEGESARYDWVKPSELNRGLPSSVEIYTLNMSDCPFGTPLTGAYARFNLNDTNLEFVVRDENEDEYGYFPKTPEQYAQAGN